MEVARVVGSVWATAKQAALERGRMLMLQPLNAAGAPHGAVIAATDTVGAGPGQIVLYVTASEAAIPWNRLYATDLVATDASVIAILDRLPLPGDVR